MVVMESTFPAKLRTLALEADCLGARMRIVRELMDSLEKEEAEILERISSLSEEEVRSFRGAFDVIGLDLSEKMIKLINERAPRRVRRSESGM